MTDGRAGSRRRAAPALAAAALALALASGCEPQMDASYLGEPLATYPGRVTTGGNPSPVEAAMLWQRGPPPSFDSLELAVRARVQPGFPASFTLRLYQPPPAAAYRTLAAGEVRFARANVAAVPYGIAGDAAPAAGMTSTFGVDADHWVVYLAAPVPPRSLTAWWLGGALPQGYALLTVTAGCRTPEALAACVAELQGLGVPEDGSGAPGTAGALCKAPYRLAPTPPGEELVLPIGAGAPAPGACP